MNTLLASIVKSREIHRNTVQNRALEQAIFHDYAEKMVAPIVDAEDKNTNMITDKLHEDGTKLRRRFQRLD